MSRPKIKDARLTLRIDMVMERERLDAIEQWLSTRKGSHRKTDIALEALENQKRIDELGGFLLPQEILILIDEYRDSVPIKPSRIDVVKGAVELLLKK